MTENITPGKGKDKQKMKYQYVQYHNSMPLSQVTLYCENIKDTNISHLDIKDFLKRVDIVATSDMLYIE